jgi:O-succinylbenzoate synthase
MSSIEQLLSSDIRLTGYSVDIVEVPFHHPVHLPFGTIETRPSAWLKVYGEVDGAYGQGAAEGTSLPMQIPMYDDYSGNLAANIDSLMAPLSVAPSTLRDARATIAATELGGNYATARMTVETSLIDLAARSQDMTVYEMLSGESLDAPLAIPYGKSIAENDYENIVAAGMQAVSNGAQRLKFKLSPKNHAAVIRGISDLESMYPEASFMVDANGTFNPEDLDHIAILRTVDQLGLMMIEEPVSRGGRLSGLVAHRALSQAIHLETPVALDDSISTYQDAQTALHEGLGEIINLKPGRVGSFLDCVDMADLAAEQGRQIMVGGMFEATPGRMMTLTLAALCLKRGFAIPGDVSLPQERLAGDLTQTNLRLDEQHNVTFAPKSGWGYML